MQKPDNHTFEGSANAGINPQLSRNYPAIQPDDSVADWSILPAERTERAGLPGDYIAYTPVNEPEAPATPAWIIIAKPVAAVAAVGVGAYGAWIALAWLIVQWKFWATVGVAVLTAVAWEIIKTPPSRRRTYEDTPRTPTKGHAETTLNGQINIYHSGNGDINVKIK